MSPSIRCLKAVQWFRSLRALGGPSASEGRFEAGLRSVGARSRAQVQSGSRSQGDAKGLPPRHRGAGPQALEAAAGSTVPGRAEGDPGPWPPREDVAAVIAEQKPVAVAGHERNFAAKGRSSCPSAAKGAALAGGVRGCEWFRGGRARQLALRGGASNHSSASSSRRVTGWLS